MGSDEGVIVQATYMEEDQVSAARSLSLNVVHESRWMQAAAAGRACWGVVQMDMPQAVALRSPAVDLWVDTGHC